MPLCGSLSIAMLAFSAPAMLLASAPVGSQEHLRTRGCSLMWSDGRPAVELALPTGFESEAQIGPDFWVHRVYRHAIPASNESGILVYVGHFPSTFESQERPERVEHEKVNALGKEIDWHCWTRTDGERRYVCESLVDDLVPERPGHNKTVLHVLTTGRSAKELREWRDVATVSIVYAPPAPPH